MSDPFTDNPDLVACAQIVEKGDPERFQAVMAAPVAARAVLFPIYAMNVEVSRAPWVTQEHMIAEMRLQWWRDALAEIAEGGLVRRHEVVTPLAMVLPRDMAKRLDDLVLARRWDIYRDPFEDQAAFEDFIGNTSGLLMQAAAAALGDSDGRTAYALGWASGLASFLTAVPELESAGRVPLVDGRPGAVRALAQKGLEKLVEARKFRSAVPQAARPALLSGWMARPILKRAATQPHLVAAGTLMPSEAAQRWRKLWVSQTGRW